MSSFFPKFFAKVAHNHQQPTTGNAWSDILISVKLRHRLYDSIIIFSGKSNAYGHAHPKKASAISQKRPTIRNIKYIYNLYNWN